MIAVLRRLLLMGLGMALVGAGGAPKVCAHDATSATVLAVIANTVCQEEAEAPATDEVFDEADPSADEAAADDDAAEDADTDAAADEPAEEGAEADLEAAADPDAAANADAAPAKVENEAEQQALADAGRNQTVQALLETKPTTPSELLRVTQTLIDLGHPIAARPLVKKLLAAQLDGPAAAALLKEVGSACLLKVARAPWIQPDGEKLADSIWSAAANYQEDPKRLNELVGKLGRGTAQEQAWTIEGLRRAGAAAAGPLLAALVRARDAKALDNVAAAILGVGEPMIPALRGAVDASPALPEQVAVSAAELLGRLEAEEATPDLVALWLNFADDSPAHLAAERALSELGHRVTTREAATAYLEDIARQFYQGKRQPRVPPGEVDENGASLVTVWRWQPGVKRFTSARVSSEAAALLEAQRSARAAYWSTIDTARQGDEVRGERAAAGETAIAARRRLLLAAIEMTIAPPAPRGAPAAAGNPRQLEESAWLGDPAIVNTVLREALDSDRLATAEVAARILGEIGSVEQLDGTAAVSPLAAAAAHGDPRVSATAIDSILRLAPQVPFVGASYVSRGLQYHLSALGLRRAVVVSPSRAEASRLVGLLAELGYEAEATTNGRVGAALAAGSVDCELVLVDFHSYDPSAWQTLAMIRRNARSMPLPVAMVSTLEVIEPANWLARNDRLTASWIRPHDAHGVEVQLAPLVARANRDRGGDARERVTAAAGLLERLLALPPESRRLFDLALLVEPLERALLHPELHVSAAKMLATLGRPAAQRALVDLASQSTAPMPLRRTAATGFADSVGTFGVMLTNVELLKQYDRYNDSEHRPRDEQQILSGLLDVLEAGRDPRRAVVE